MTGTFVIAVDGPSGTGKSTVSRAVADKLGAGYLDTGALYRLVTAQMHLLGVDPADQEAVTAALTTIELTPPTDPHDQRQLLGEVDVTDTIRGGAVTADVSAVAANPAVREFLLQLQRQIAHSGRMVVEGRDIGSVIAPDADLKIFLTADAAVRAQRRQAQDAAEGRSTDVAAVEADLQRRDKADASRKTAPLTQPADAVIIDSTDLTIEQTIMAVLNAAAAHGIGKAASDGH